MFIHLVPLWGWQREPGGVKYKGAGIGYPGVATIGAVLGGIKTTSPWAIVSRQGYGHRTGEDPQAGWIAAGVRSSRGAV